MNIFKRFRQAWSVSKYPEELLEKQAQLAEAIDAVQGDGKAVFFDEGTEADWKEQEKEDQGLLGIFGLGKKKPEVITHDEI